MWQSSPALPAHMATRLHALLHHCTHEQPVWVARAPGRLDVMGGIADYSGSLVLQLPLDVAAIVAVQPRTDTQVVVTSLADASLLGQATVTCDLATLLACQGDWEQLRTALAATATPHWASYIIGVLPVVWHHAGCTPASGVTIVVDSTVPLGKGVSSSAAIEVATMRAYAAALALPLAGRELAFWSQYVENMVVGAPCGIMDQMTSACGVANRLMALRCQPAELLGHVTIPADVAVWGIDSGLRHAVSGADYGSVRVGAFMGYRIIAEQAGLPITYVNGRAHIDDQRWHGYLANVTPSEFAQEFASIIPHQLTGQDFIERYHATSDAITRVDPVRTYAVWQPTVHPIMEHQRVRLFAQLIDQPQISDETASLLGELMYQSHASYSACGLGSVATDAIVRAVRQHGPNHGLYGAKITGGGSGGTVAVLGRPEAAELVARIATEYGSGLLFSGSSDGAAASPVWQMRKSLG